MRLFEITAPDGRIVRQMAVSAEDLKGRLVSGYGITGIVYLAKEDTTGGFVAPLDGSTTVMGALLEAHGDELLAWLKGRL